MMNQSTERELLAERIAAVQSANRRAIRRSLLRKEQMEIAARMSALIVERAVRQLRGRV
jgi:hypothetical protein